MTFYSNKEEVVSIVGKKTSDPGGKFPCQGVEFDSRNIKGGELFVALKGEATHGHDYVGEAYKRGAALFLVEDTFNVDTFPEKDRLIIVSDTLNAFWSLATFWRRKLNLPTIAVTGSVGKTTTKEILASLLLQKGPGNYALKSFNNHVGVPYTILRSAPSHLWCVLEMGMNREGEIEGLSRMAEPDVAVVTEVAPAHIGAFGSIDKIADEKVSILKGLRKGGSLVINGDNALIQEAVKRLGVGNAFKVISAGQGIANDYRVSKVTGKEDLSITFRIEAKEFSFDGVLSVPGTHNAMNGVIACAAAKTLFPTFSSEELQGGFAKFRAPLMRLNVKAMGDGRDVLDDSYNANPSSMKALLGIAGEVKERGKKIGLILGDMLELGQDSERYHRELGQAVGNLAPSFLIHVGPMGPFVVEEAQRKGVRATAVNSPLDASKMAVTEQFDMLFVKGSRGIKLDQAVNALLPPLQS